MWTQADFDARFPNGCRVTIVAKDSEDDDPDNILFFCPSPMVGLHPVPYLVLADMGSPKIVEVANFKVYPDDTGALVIEDEDRRFLLSTPTPAAARMIASVREGYRSHVEGKYR